MGGSKVHLKPIDYQEKKIREFINIGPSNTLTSWVFESNQYPELKVIEAWDLL